MKPVKKLGTHRQRHHAKHTLQFEPIGEATWRVWGGYAEHIVTQAADRFTCDCWHNQTTGGICSHIIKIVLNEQA